MVGGGFSLRVSASFQGKLGQHSREVGMAAGDIEGSRGARTTMVVSIGIQKRCNIPAMCCHTGFDRIIKSFDELSIATILWGW